VDDKEFTVEISEVTMTPALATTLLEGNTANRRLNPRRVRSLVTALTAGEYQFDGTPVRLADDGRVLDGQHRLEAVRASGVSVPMLLIKNLDPSIQLVLDTGKSRSFVDFLTIHGVTNATNAGATALLLWHWEEGHVASDVSWSYRPGPTHSGLWAFYQEHQDDIARAIKETLLVRRKIRIAPSVIATAFLILEDVDTDVASDFFSELRFEEGPGPQVSVLVRVLNARRERSVRDFTQQEQLALLFKTWNLYRRDEVIDKLQWLQSRKKKEKFPLPV
jgi:hypothetical protein